MTKALLKSNSTNFSFLLHQSSHFVTKGCQVGQAQFPLLKATITTVNHLRVLLMSENGFIGEFAPSSSRRLAEVEQSANTQILLPFLEAKATLAFFQPSSRVFYYLNLSKQFRLVLL